MNADMEKLIADAERHGSITALTTILRVPYDTAEKVLDLIDQENINTPDRAFTDDFGRRWEWCGGQPETWAWRITSLSSTGHLDELRTVISDTIDACQADGHIDQDTIIGPTAIDLIAAAIHGHHAKVTDTPYKLPDGLNFGWRDGYRVTFIAADGNTRTGICHQVGDRYVIEADNPVERATETITRMEGVIRAITEETE